MKLADCPPDMRAALDLERWDGYLKLHQHPANGDVWFTYNHDDYSERICAMCGGPDTRRLAKDHCHVTGLFRGELCVGCNLAEGRNHGTQWHWWRRFAPGLATRAVVEAHRNPLLLLDEIRTLGMDELFALAKSRTSVFMAMERDAQHPGWSGYTPDDRARHLMTRPFVQVWGTA